MDSELRDLAGELHLNDVQTTHLENTGAALIAASNKALLLRVREGLPKLHEQKLLNSSEEVRSRFYRDGGHNFAINQALAVIDAEIEGL